MTYFPAPASPTGEELIEFSLHGNPVLLDALVERLVGLGARHALPGEFTRRALQNGAMDLAQAECVAALIGALSLEEAGAIKRGLDGELGRRIDKVIAAVSDLLVRVEHELDVLETELSWDPRTLGTELSSLLEEVRTLRACRDAQVYLRGERTIVLLGAANVGKSTLLNALLGYERALVDSLPGTTRDYLEEQLYIAGLPVTLCDTAGLRSQPEGLEARGIEATREVVNRASLVLAVFDGTREPDLVDAELPRLAVEKALVVVINKCDAPEYRFERYTSLLPRALPISARDGEGIPELRRRLAEVLTSTSSAPEDVLYIGERQAVALDAAAEALGSVIFGLEHGASLDMVAMDLRWTLDRLADIARKVPAEEVLERIFSRFCVGK
ncbi:MAG: hypothetical protein A2284_05490 [Deltaproteobacteria bacterium RIFOXYA12_FULL_61_11]|nr:MAG: hypothetical protein A2284_05490 [Deltaproteobacteria bacterium RIFOXYA12_FULL_61_11]